MLTEKKFERLAKQVFGTPTGRLLLKRMKEDYVDPKAFSTSSEETFYKLGQKELVQDLIMTINNPEELDRSDSYLEDTVQSYDDNF